MARVLIAMIAKIGDQTGSLGEGEECLLDPLMRRGVSERLGPRPEYFNADGNRDVATEFAGKMRCHLYDDVSFGLWLDFTSRLRADWASEGERRWGAHWFATLVLARELVPSFGTMGRGCQ